MKLLALIVMIALAGCRSAPPARPRQPIAMTLPALDGGEIELGAYRGKVVVLHVFTTWSLGATGDVSQLIAAHAAAGDDVAVIGIALDVEGYPLVSPWRSALAVRYLIALADDEFRAGRSPLGKVAEVPTTILLDHTGAIGRRFDRSLSEGELQRAIDELRDRR